MSNIIYLHYSVLTLSELSISTVLISKNQGNRGYKDIFLMISNKYEINLAIFSWTYKDVGIREK
jgi:hypothetical protein